MPEANPIDTIPKTGERFLLEYRPYRFDFNKKKWVPSTYTKIIEARWDLKKNKVVEWGGEKRVQYVPSLEEDTFVGWFPNPRS